MTCSRTRWETQRPGNPIDSNELALVDVGARRQTEPQGAGFGLHLFNHPHDQHEIYSHHPLL